MLRLCVILFQLFALSALGQEQALESKKYVGDDVPLGVAFYSLLLMPTHLAMEGESTEAVDTIQQRLEVDFNSADDVLAIMLETRLAIDKDTSALISALACLDSDPYEVFAQMYDIREDIGLIHYRKFLKRFDEVTADYFDDWIERTKRSMVYSRIDHKSMYESRGGDAAQDLKQMCQRGLQ